jgi:threonine synthase
LYTFVTSLIICLHTNWILSYKPYNFERLLYYLTDENHKLVNEWMITMENTAKLDLDNTPWYGKLQTEFSSARITDDEMCSSMKRVYDEFHYLIDPHTAVAVATADKLGYDMYTTSTTTNNNNHDKVDSRRPLFSILSTASPCKFEESVTIGVGEEIWKRYMELEFPKRATSILKKIEVEPVMYRWDDDKSLDEVQIEWEQLARSHVAKF